MTATTRRSRATKDRITRDARKAEERSWFGRLAQAGLGARATIYFILAGLAFETAVKGTSTTPDSQGALVEIARQPGGRLLLVVLAAGFAAYAGWRLIQAVAGQPGARDALLSRVGWAATALLYTFLCAEAVELAAGSSTSNASSHPEPLVARVLGWPAGPVLLGLVAVLAALAGIALGVWGVAHDYRRIIDAKRMGRWFEPARVAGAIGDIARGLLVVLVAVYLFLAVVTENPTKAKGLGPALQSFAHMPAGPVLLGLIGVGLFAFACYSVAEAAFRRPSR
jgi:hypothetical protein